MHIRLSISCCSLWKSKKPPTRQNPTKDPNLAGGLSHNVSGITVRYIQSVVTWRWNYAACFISTIPSFTLLCSCLLRGKQFKCVMPPPFISKHHFRFTFAAGGFNFSFCIGDSTNPVSTVGAVPRYDFPVILLLQHSNHFLYIDIGEMIGIRRTRDCIGGVITPHIWSFRLGSGKIRCIPALNYILQGVQFFVEKSLT